TSLINAWPVDDLALDSQLDLNGNLLLYKDTLVVLGNDNKIYGYNVSDPKNPEKSWEMKIDDNSYLVSSRLYNGQVYLITSTYINASNPCPYRPLISDSNSLEIRCVDIYHPINPSYTDSTYTAIALDAQSGEIKDSVSFLGSNYNSLVYMSANNLYITYASDMPNFEISYEFFAGSGRDLLPATVFSKLSKLKTYDISYQAKELELQTILSEWQNSLNSDQRLKLENDLQNKMTDYYKENQRRFVATGIVKIALDNMDISDNGKVPGRPLNQFSLDEYNGNLRVATNIGNNGFGMMFFNSDQSANDVYVLDDSLKIIGSVKDLGLAEKIYSVRFIEDRGYLVTFKQIDPFYILDLSNPKNPLMTGELKIPGYSSYLQQLEKNKILGIGMEDSKLKLSYFDVSDPKNPQEIDKYNLDEYGSETLYDHHAFLLDSEQKIFFLPGYNGGYIFGYANDKLELLKAVSLSDVKRALYIENYLYIISTNSLIVLDEKNWEEVNDLEFKK
ncbi:MAG: beta-propeller domain-containing protein, partial [bacterium]|nr:beta-propeller domain-containing protein [bacterium]